MRIFFDSSAFVKRYVREPGSDEVLGWCDRADEIGLSGIAVPEIISAFCRLRREGRIDYQVYQRLKAELMLDIEDVLIGALTPEVTAHAISSLEAHVLRGMDALHIGSAVAMKADVFVSADRRQSDAAGQAGLQIALI